MISTEEALLLVIIIVISIAAGFIFNKFRILKVNYYFHEGELDSKNYLDKHPLSQLIPRYQKYLTLLVPIGLSWAVFGILNAIVQFNQKIFGIQIRSPNFSNILLVWLLISGILLVFLPLLLATERISLPQSFESLINRGTFTFLFTIGILGVTLAYFILDLTLLGSIVLLFLTIPAIISAWFAGEFYAVFTIRKFYNIKGWDYVDGRYSKIDLKGIISRLMAGMGFILLVLSPILAINSLISVFSSDQIREKGGPLGVVSGFILPEWLMTIVIFILVLGPLVSIATQPSSFLELTINSNVYDTLSKFDWEEFNRRTAKMQDIIRIRPHSQGTMAGILAVFLSFIIYVSILSIGSIANLGQTFLINDIVGLSVALKFIEVPVLFYILYQILNDLRQEKEIIDIARLGLRERRDVTGWTFWILQNLYDGNYRQIEQNLDLLLSDPIISKNHRVQFYKGLTYALQGENAKAEKFFQRSIELKPNYIDGWFELATVQYFQDKLDIALDNFEKAKEIDKNYKLIHYGMGRVYDKLKQFDNSVECYLCAIKLDKTDNKSLTNYGMAMIEIGKLEEGIKATERALELDPSDDIAKHNLAIANQKIGNMEKYKEIMTQLVNNPPENPTVFDILVNNLVIDKRYTEADELYQQIVKTKRVNQRNIAGLYEVYAYFNRYRVILPILINFLKENKTNYHIWYLLGHTYLILEDREKAIENLEIGLKANKPHVQNIFDLLKCYVETGSNKTNDLIVSALKWYPNDANVQYNSGYVKFQTGRTDLDDNFFKSLKIEFRPYVLSDWLQIKQKIGTLNDTWIEHMKSEFAQFQPDVEYALGSGYYFLQQFDKAKFYFDKALTQGLNLELTEDIGSKFLDAELYEEAITIFESFLEDNPSNVVFNSLGFAYLRLNQIDHALMLFIEGHESFPEDTLIIENIVKIMTSSKRYPEALVYYEKLFLSYPENAQYIYEYATCQALSNDILNAKINYQKALSLTDDEVLITQINEMLNHLNTDRNN